ncbi:hypothetical protein ASF58_20970 [Methylobacterium sp. Leaf125]|jgi:hypothetical protein|uniref:hypothetical protein n=1 Tax=unclassified Methylobacterium TaxID=2615210 RepID=UPI0006F4C752|nr:MULTISPECIES: hypothetical protein [unclassified Methylobacterium]KQQ44411.1 hypothetical protein ASF58_20970 [Methylobacterium sp. Leaf125]POR41392.1 hypothetical protein CRT23_18885 [Methylobacterium sp. V23]
MKSLCAAAVLGLTVLGSISPVLAQPYRGYEDGYRGRDEGYRGRDDGYRDRDGDFRDRGRGYGRRDYGFDEGEYLRCNPDVRRAVNRGQMESGAAHYRVFGRREGRRLSC